MKILRIIARLNVGGPARHVVLLDRGLRARGHDTLLVYGMVGPGEASLEHLATSAGLRVQKVAALGPRINAFRDAGAFVELLRIIFREAPDVIHSHTAKAGTLARLSAAVYNATRGRDRRALVVHTFHGHVLNGYFGRAGSIAVRVAERTLSKLTDCIITISPRQQSDIVTRFRVAAQRRVATIPLGLDLQPLLTPAPSDPSALRHELRIPDGDVVIGYVGRFVRIKDLATLVAAFVAVANQVSNATLLLVGNGPLRRELEDAVCAARIATRVHFVDWTEDLAAVYGALDICVLTSLNEGTPVALIEAMAAGKPVVATDVGGVPDVVDHGRTGLLVPAGSIDTLATVLIDLIRDGVTRSRMGEAAREDVASRFSHLRLVEDIDRLYEARLATKRGTIRTIS